ncbi:hypothetical protein EDB19DRAFT_1826687 [Suillus lakei]|nr:hypothetical protein EDB19DRAFT_1826687 [Suillus lakei]
MSIQRGVALITGSAQGIGREIALHLTRDGLEVALDDVATKYDQLIAIEIEGLGRKTCIVPVDVSEEDHVVDCYSRNPFLSSEPTAAAHCASKFAVRSSTWFNAIRRCMIGNRQIKHNGLPEHIASIVNYLASKEAHFITECHHVEVHEQKPATPVDCGSTTATGLFSKQE